MAINPPQFWDYSKFYPNPNPDPPGYMLLSALAGGMKGYANKQAEERRARASVLAGTLQALVQQEMVAGQPGYQGQRPIANVGSQPLYLNQSPTTFDPSTFDPNQSMTSKQLAMYDAYTRATERGAGMTWEEIQKNQEMLQEAIKANQRSGGALTFSFDKPGRVKTRVGAYDPFDVRMSEREPYGGEPLFDEEINWDSIEEESKALGASFSDAIAKFRSMSAEQRELILNNSVKNKRISKNYASAIRKTLQGK